MNNQSRTGPDNPTALVAGASQRLGSVLTTFLAGQGHDPVLTAREASDLDTKAESLTTSDVGAEMHTLPGDALTAEGFGCK